jgi:hypothetical protein
MAWGPKSMGCRNDLQNLAFDVRNGGRTWIAGSVIQPQPRGALDHPAQGRSPRTRCEQAREQMPSARSGGQAARDLARDAIRA